MYVLFRLSLWVTVCVFLPAPVCSSHLHDAVAQGEVERLQHPPLVGRHSFDVTVRTPSYWRGPARRASTTTSKTLEATLSRRIRSLLQQEEPDLGHKYLEPLTNVGASRSRKTRKPNTQGS
jgi:hypothetical protein